MVASPALIVENGRYPPTQTGISVFRERASVETRFTIARRRCRNAIKIIYYCCPIKVDGHNDIRLGC